MRDMNQIWSETKFLVVFELILALDTHWVALKKLRFSYYYLLLDLYSFGLQVLKNKLNEINS